MRQKKYTLATIADTKKLAQTIAGQLCGGETIGLIGNLGAGKTTFTQLLAQAIGVKEVVNSPTFNIIKIYSLSFRTDPPAGGEDPESRQKINHLVHIDAYRLNSPEELQALGVEEYFDDPHTITIIEWADRVKKILPSRTITITLELQNNQRIAAITNTIT